MAAISTIIAVGALIVGAAGVYVSVQARADAAEAAGKSAEEQRKAKAEQQALNAQKAANERRQQVREERVRRAKIEQGSENTGTSGSSGELGSVAGLASQLGANIGTNIGQLQGANAISGFNQAASDFNTSAQNSMFRAGVGDSIFALSGSAFNAAGGFNTIRTAYNKP